MNTERPATAIILTAGSGSRMQGHVSDKVLGLIHGQPVLFYSLSAFAACPWVTHVVLVYRDSAQFAQMQQLLAERQLALPWELRFVSGGAQRQDSVWEGLQCIDWPCSEVYIHDGARPLLRSENLQALRSGLSEVAAVSLAARPADTIKRFPLTLGSAQCADAVWEDLDRSRLWAMQTPQAFHFPGIREAHAQVRRDGIAVTDDVAVWNHTGQPARMIPNPYPNLKLTCPQDWAYCETLLCHPHSRQFPFA